MRSILILAFSDLNHDARVNRQVNFLKNDYDISVASFTTTSIEGATSFTLKRVRPSLLDKFFGGLALLLGLYDSAYRIIYNERSYLGILENNQYDVILANDIETLPLAMSLSKNGKIIFDAHEYAPRHFEDKLVWRIFFSRFNKYLCKKYLPRVSAMLTVGKGLANEYAKDYPVKPIVLTNANYYKELSTQETDPQSIKLVHHGAANPSRQLELMIKAMDYVDNHFHLDLILLTPTIANKKTRQYLDYLKNLVKNNPKVSIVPPVKSSEVIDLIHQYDVGVFLIPPINFNYKNTLPNKLFDFVQARLAIAIGPTPEMVSLVNEFDIGVVAKDFTAESFGKILNQLTVERIDYYKSQSAKAARQLSAENNKVIMTKIVGDLMDQ